MENYDNSNEISLLELWQRIWKNKILVISITLIITLLGVSILYVVNQGSKSLSNKFNYEFIGQSESRYPDGSVYSIKDLTHVDFLREVKDSNSDFSNLDVVKLASDENFTIVRVDVMNDKTDEVVRRHLQIELPLKYFENDKELATSFIEALHEKQIAKIVSKNDAQLLPNMFLYNGKNIIGEGSEEPFIKRGEEVSYDEIFKLIENQYAMLKLKMENFNAKYPNVKNDHALNTSSMINNLENWFNTTVKLSVLRNHVVTQNFLRNKEEELRNLRAELVYLEEQIDFNKDVKKELIITSNDLKGELQETQVSEFAKELVNIDKTILTLELRKKHVKDYIDANAVFGDDTEFLKQLQRYANRLVEETEDFNVFAIKHINSLVRYNDEYSPSIEFKSKFNMALMSIVLLMVGGIAGVSAGLIKGSVKKED